MRISHQPKQVRNLHQASAKFAPSKCEFRTSPCKCEFRTSPWDFGSKSPLFCRLHMRSFLLYFFDVNSFLIPVISQSQALLCKDYKRGGNHLSENMLHFTLSEIFLSGRNTKFFLLSFSLFYFLFLGSQTTSEDVFPEDERLNLWFLGVKEAR